MAEGRGKNSEISSQCITKKITSQDDRAEEKEDVEVCETDSVFGGAAGGSNGVELKTESKDLHIEVTETTSQVGNQSPGVMELDVVQPTAELKNLHKVTKRILESGDGFLPEVPVLNGVGSTEEPVDFFKKQGENDIEAQFVLERALIHYKKFEYASAAMLLDGSHISESNLFIARLLLAECHMHSGEPRKAKKHIEAVKNIIVSSGLWPNQVTNYANGFLHGSVYTRTIIFYRIASDMFKVSSPPSVGLYEIFSCISKIDDATRPMIKLGGNARKLGIEYGVEFMIQAYNCLESIEEANSDSKAKFEGLASERISLNFYLAGEYEKCLKYCEIGVAKLERHFGPKASEHLMYGQLLHRVAITLFSLDRFAEAESHYVKAMEASKSATDFVGDNVKQLFMESLKSQLWSTRAKLGKVCCCSCHETSTSAAQKLI